MIYVIKRNGDKQEFDTQKIINAINAAFLEVDNCLYYADLAKNIAYDIYNHFQKANIEQINIEDLQNLIEEELMISDRKDVARAYVRYRYKKEVARECKADFIEAIGDKLQAKNIQNQNANVDEASFGGRVGEASSVMTKDYALNYIVSDLTRKNHIENMIYTHDLDAYAVGSHNCLSIPFDKLLAEGFNTRQGDIRTAGSLSTAFQLVAVIFQLQSLQQFGGVSATHLDWTMVPYVRKSFYKHYKDGIKYIENPKIKTEIMFELSKNKIINTSIDDTKVYNLSDAYNFAMDMTIKECNQSIEAMYHNLNTLQSRSGNQLPFTSINYGTCISTEGRMIIKGLLEGSIAGIGKVHRTSVFPCGIFQLGKGINREPGDPNYDLYQLALKSTAQRLYPNYANIDWSGNAGYDPSDPRTYFSTMGCRTSNGEDINGLGQQKDGRGNICPVTIILPTLAMIAQEKIGFNDDINNWIIKDENNKEYKVLGYQFTNNVINNFLSLLDKKIDEAKDILLERFEWICSQSPASAKFMYENGLMEGYIPEEGIRSALKHGTLAIGQLGLAETLQILIGCDHTEPEGMRLAKQIEQLFKNKCIAFKEEYKLNFGVYFTPEISVGA